jgi:twitching motility protein PilT
MTNPIYEIPVSLTGTPADAWMPPPAPADATLPSASASSHAYPPPAAGTAYAPPVAVPAYAPPASAPAAYAPPASAPGAYAPPAAVPAYQAPAPVPAASEPHAPGDASAPAQTHRLVPEGRRAAETQPEPAVSETATPTSTSTRVTQSIDDSLTDVERAALLAADPELIAALHEIVRQRGSDLHLTVDAAPTIRVDGGLKPVGSVEPWSREKVLAALTSLLTPHQLEIFERELELDFAFTVSSSARFRVNFYQQRGSLGAAFRLIPTEIKQLKELGVPESIGGFSQLPRGLVLVTGPTGSGKSTTLAAMIDLVNSTRADHIVTVEDPIEFLHHHKKSLINQREVGHDTHSFGAALKHVLRQDPDVILIGELRDLETISVALTAAETGHLVFATLHTQDAPQTIDRVIDVFPPHQQDQVRAQLAATLQGVVCQTLVKRADGRGRVVATEVLMTTPAIANLIREGKTYQIASMMQAGRAQGMHTMDQHLADLVNTGKITHKAAFDKAHDPEGLHRLIQRVESPADASARAMASGGPDYGDAYSGAVL